MDKSEDAVEKFMSGFNCSQSVFSTYSEKLGLDSQTALKVACPFGAGMAYSGETCGAVTGALMLIGLKYGKYSLDDLAAKEKTYSLTHKFIEEFRKQYGSLKCSDLLGYDMTKPEEREVVLADSINKVTCPKYVQNASELIEKLLFEGK
ncbi:MAG: C-GCAxxG-C-C family protein [Ignavibacteria bacterium]